MTAFPIFVSNNYSATAVPMVSPLSRSWFFLGKRGIKQPVIPEISTYKQQLYNIKYICKNCFVKYIYCLLPVIVEKRELLHHANLRRDSLYRAKAAQYRRALLYLEG